MKPLLLISIIASLLMLVLPSLGAERVIREWDFAKGTDTQGWTSAETIKDLKSADGALVAVAGTGSPKLQSPPFEIDATAWQYVEVEVKSDNYGTGVMHYSGANDKPGEPSGASQFSITGDEQFHTYTIRPFWQKQGRITRVRLDLAGDNVAVRAIRIVDTRAGEPSRSSSWTFKGATAGWQPVGLAGKPELTPIGCEISGNRDAFLFSPPISLESEKYSCVTVRIASKTAHTALLRWASDTTDGLQSIPINLRADKMVHSYSLDLRNAVGWRGNIVVLGVSPCESGESKSIMLESVSLGDGPTGPAEIEIARFELDNAGAQSTQKHKLVLEVKNTGGKVAESVAAVVTLVHLGDPATDLLKTSKTMTLANKRAPRIAPGETARFEWEVSPGKGAERLAVCRVTGVNLDAGQRSITLPSP